MFREDPKVEDTGRWFISHDLRLGESSVPGAGIGVFATKDIPARTVVESSPIILMAQHTFEVLNEIHPPHRHILSDYPFQWTNNLSAIAIGWGSLLNHSFEPNLMWEFRREEDVGYNALWFRTKRNISAGEELFVRYVWDHDKLWFVDEDADEQTDMRTQIRRGGSTGMQVNQFFADIRMGQSLQERGHDVETLGDWTKVTKKKQKDGED